MNSTNPFADLEPRGLWKHFEAITRIARPSGQEERMAGYVRAWAAERGYEMAGDATGNLCVHVPARPGCESGPVVVLQSHLDMVCERDSTSPHDAARGDIRVVRQGDWLGAEGTTLGADNGIGCAAMLYMAEREDLRRGPLDLLFTVDEERGLTGAKTLDPAIVRGRTLLNLDSEDDGWLVVGCAGGRGAVFNFTGQRKPIPAGWVRRQISVSGLQGGHSGLDIHRGRLNAIKAMAHVLMKALPLVPVRLESLTGGDKTNAIPRECQAVVGLLVEQEAEFRQAIEQARLELIEQHRGRDEGLVVRVAEPESGESMEPFSGEDTTRLLHLLLAIPSGVLGMSAELPDLVESSNNLGVVRTLEDRIEIRCSARSSDPGALRGVLDAFQAIARAGGAAIQISEGYPGWKPEMSSRVLEVARRTYERLFRAEPKVTAIHAGLECGLIGERIPGMDMLSLGPEIKGVHAPGERVQISSVERFAKLLGAILEDLATAS